MNNFIISGKGFLKMITFNKETKEHTIEWTHSVRDADRFKTGKTASQIITKYQLDGFVWNPYNEEPIRDKWEVIQRTPEFWGKEEILEWMPSRVTMEKKSDVRFLMTKGVEKKTYYDSYEEALNVAHTKNLEIIEKLQTRMEAMGKSTKMS